MPGKETWKKRWLITLSGHFNLLLPMCVCVNMKKEC